MMMTRYLYHYTTVESLALILANKSIKFNPLTNLDDPLEAQFSDYDAFGSLCFVSGWTDVQKERHEMWNAYSSKRAGVRIALEENPFRIYENPPQQVAKGIICERLKRKGPNDPIQSLIPIKEMREQGFTCAEALTIDNLLCKVIYTDNEELLRPSVSEDRGLDGMLLHLNKVGRHKAKLWEYQSEWRYRLRIMPGFLLEPSPNWGDLAVHAFEVVAKNRLRLGFDSIFLKISGEAFKRMRITMSPCITDANRAIVNALVAQYNPDATLVESELKGYVK